MTWAMWAWAMLALLSVVLGGLYSRELIHQWLYRVDLEAEETYYRKRWARDQYEWNSGEETEDE